MAVVVLGRRGQCRPPYGFKIVLSNTQSGNQRLVGRFYSTAVKQNLSVTSLPAAARRLIVGVVIEVALDIDDGGALVAGAGGQVAQGADKNMPI